MGMGFFSFLSSIAEVDSELTKKVSLFKEIDAGRERLQSFDLGAPTGEPKPKVRT